MWFYADQDMPAYSSLMSSKYLTGDGNDGNQWSFQLDVNGNDKIRWRSAKGANTHPNHTTHTVTNSTYSKSQWTHAAFVKHDNGTSQIYLNGVLEATSSETQNTPLDSLRIGVNRRDELQWKGYIDEFKVYGRAFTADNVTDACLLYEECEKYVKPNTPTGLTATDPGSGTSINLTWNASTGADNYTIYWTDDPSTPIDPSNPSTYDGSTTVTGTSATATGLTNGTNYDFTVVATNDAGNSPPATEVNATPVYVAPGITVTHNAGPNGTDNSTTRVNEAGYATGFVEWEVTGTGYGVAEWQDLIRDSAGNIYHTQYYNGTPTVIKRNSIGVQQCSASVSGYTNGNSLDPIELMVDSENNLYLVGYTYAQTVRHH